VRPFPIGIVSVLYQARWVLTTARDLHDGGGLLVEDGRVLAVALNPAQVRERRSESGVEHVDLGDVALCPGLVNAHAHLELSGLGGRVPGGLGFVPWVGAVLRERSGLTYADHARAAEAGLRELLATGTTAVGDVDSTGAAAERLARSPLRARVYREVLDGRDPARTAAQVAALEAPWPEVGRVSAGYSPHAPHTVSQELLEACVRKASELDRPLSIHWAETAEEREWSLTGAGPFASLIGPAPRVSGLEVLRRAGVLELRTSLVHANFPEAHELRFAAEAGAILVHCPGTHAFFGREPAPLEAWAASGATIALGTDSRASNEALDMRREMALVRASHPALEASSVLDWATRCGAVALGLEHTIGELTVGKAADFVTFDLGGLDSGADPVDTITATAPEVLGVWIGGCPI
jgi:cytosine/adenosine deaminase-related metal-dependent hydrolase